MKMKIKTLTASRYWVLFKWSLMVAALFWMVVFKLSEQGIKLPDFVYVHF